MTKKAGCITGIWFHLSPYSDELYSKLRAELVIDGKVAESWSLNEVPHRHIKRFPQACLVNIDAEYSVRLTFIDAVEVAHDTEFWAGLTCEPSSTLFSFGSLSAIPKSLAPEARAS